MKRLKLKQGVKNFIGVVMFYLMLLLGVILINARIEQTQDVSTKKTDTCVSAQEVASN